MVIRVLSTTLLLGLVAATGGCTSTAKSPPTPVSRVDLPRYMGRWYVISNVPYFLERGKVASYDTYALRPDGTLSNDFTFRSGEVTAPEKTWHGKATIIDATTNATWRVSFFWPVSVTYKIFALDPAYQWAVVGTGDADLLWVLARERQMAPALHEAIERELQGVGIATDKLVRVPQPAIKPLSPEAKHP